MAHDNAHSCISICSSSVSQGTMRVRFLESIDRLRVVTTHCKTRKSSWSDFLIWIDSKRALREFTSRFRRGIHVRLISWVDGINAWAQIMMLLVWSHVVHGVRILGIASVWAQVRILFWQRAMTDGNCTSWLVWWIYRRGNFWNNYLPFSPSGTWCGWIRNFRVWTLLVVIVLYAITTWIHSSLCASTLFRIFQCCWFWYLSARHQLLVVYCFGKGTLRIISLHRPHALAFRVLES